MDVDTLRAMLAPDHPLQDPRERLDFAVLARRPSRGIAPVAGLLPPSLPRHAAAQRERRHAP